MFKLARTEKTWSRARRVVGKAEHLAVPIFASWSGTRIDARALYDSAKWKTQEQQLPVRRPSSATMTANQAFGSRRWPTSAQRVAPDRAPPHPVCRTCGTIRKLLIGGAPQRAADGPGLGLSLAQRVHARLCLPERVPAIAEPGTPPPIRPDSSDAHDAIFLHGTRQTINSGLNRPDTTQSPPWPPLIGSTRQIATVGLRNAPHHSPPRKSRTVSMNEMSGIGDGGPPGVGEEAPDDFQAGCNSTTRPRCRRPSFRGSP